MPWLEKIKSCVGGFPWPAIYGQGLWLIKFLVHPTAWLLCLHFSLEINTEASKIHLTISFHSTWCLFSFLKVRISSVIWRCGSGSCVCARVSVNADLCSFHRAFCDLSVLKQQSEWHKVRVLFSVHSGIILVKLKRRIGFELGIIYLSKYCFWVRMTHSPIVVERDGQGHKMSESEVSVIKSDDKVKSKLNVNTKADFDKSR